MQRSVKRIMQYHSLATDASRGQLAHAADANFVVHAGWPVQRLSAGWVDERSDLVLIDSGMPCDTFNIICRARLEAERARRRVHAAVDHFRTVGRPFSWWVGPGDQPVGLPALLEAVGLTAAESELAMAVPLSELEEAAAGLDPGLTVERVRTPAALATFARLCAANWTPPDPWVERYYHLNAAALLEDDCPLWLYLGRRHGEPVAIAEVTVTGDVAGLYNLFTLPAHRGQGIGSALTVHPLLDARAHGCRTAVLQAAAAGVHIYERAGFRAYGNVTEYKPR